MMLNNTRCNLDKNEKHGHDEEKDQTENALGNTSGFAPRLCKKPSMNIGTSHCIYNNIDDNSPEKKRGRWFFNI